MKEIYSDVCDEEIDPETEADDETEEEAEVKKEVKEFVIYNKSQQPTAEQVEQPVILESAATLIETVVEKVLQEESVVPAVPVVPVVPAVPVVPVTYSKPKYVIRAEPPMESAGCDAMCSRPTKRVAP